MINVQEIRVGNIVEFEKPVHVQLGDILSTHGNHFVKLSSYGIHLVDTDEKTVINAIPITSEVLTSKCGFLSDSTGKHWIGDFELYPVGKGFDYDGKTLVTSVHQLQNLYYFNEGSELPVNF